jgi:hypothetical protein
VNRVVHLLVDFENLKPSPADVALVRSDAYRLWVFHGPHQNKFDATLVKAWQPLGDRVDFVQSSKQGKNALDFHIAFKLGVLHVHEHAGKRDASYVVVSGDGGFEPLFEYMRTLGCTVTRAGSIPEALAICQVPAQVRVPVAGTTPEASRRVRPSRGIIPAASTPKPAPKLATAPKKKAAATPTPALRKTIADGDVATVRTALQSNPKSRPGDRAALEQYVVTRLGQKVTVKVARAVIHQLEQQKVIAFDGKKVVYRDSKAKN